MTEEKNGKKHIKGEGNLLQQERTNAVYHIALHFLQSLEIGKELEAEGNQIRQIGKNGNALLLRKEPTRLEWSYKHLSRKEMASMF